MMWAVIFMRRTPFVSMQTDSHRKDPKPSGPLTPRGLAVTGLPSHDRQLLVRIRCGAEEVPGPLLESGNVKLFELLALVLFNSLYLLASQSQGSYLIAAKTPSSIRVPFGVAFAWAY